ncbi:MAG: ATP-binding protein [Alysiella sp.]|uniref:ATP-binding protein n=1 Tax=Alysiella sp. TaxID=1872483 RepID=UPI0026DC8558|nr:ATP-binding protein [Alysiella sp.]MDO4433701.1 ATP-binding protein [Alysiella sp.]
MNAHVSPNQANTHKYLGLTILVVSFLVLTVTMLVTNFFATRYFTKQAQITTLATQQGVVIQQMSKNLMDTDLAIRAQIYALNTSDPATHLIALDTLSQDTLYRISEINSLKTEFEQSLQTFEKGGKLHGTEIQAATGKAADHVRRIREIWQPYLGLIENFIEDTSSKQINPKTSAYLVDYTRLYNQTLLKETQALADILNARTQYQANIWRTIQLVAVALAFVLFGWIMFGTLRQLTKGDKLIARANQEMSEIMASVREGLFLIDRHFVIGNQYSTHLEELIGINNLAGRNFLEIAETLLPESEIETLQVFVEQLYSEWVMEDLIEDLNPLHRITIINDNNQPRYLDFRFFRVMHDNKIERVLVNVVDSTQAVLLQESLEAQQEQEKREMEMLNTILNTDPAILHGFIETTKQRLTEVNNTLKKDETSQTELRNKVHFIGRVIHGIKGESSALKLRRMVEICHTLEDTLVFLRSQKQLSGQDFLGLVVSLEDLYRLNDILSNYSQRVSPHVAPHHEANATQSKHQPVSGSSSLSPVHARLTHLQKFVQDIAQREHKQARLSTEGFEHANLSEQQWQQVQDILMQILRNAVVHGIEKPEVRETRQKSTIGCLKITFSQDENGFQIIAQDDGNGIDFDSIRHKAQQSGRYTEEQIAQFSRNQLLTLMMSDGFSTLNHASEDAGKGIGMGIIKETVRDMGGKINIASAFTQYTRFTFSFPKKA